MRICAVCYMFRGSYIHKRRALYDFKNYARIQKSLKTT
jgi:hypothetical protein